MVELIELQKLRDPRLMTPEHNFGARTISQAAPVNTPPRKACDKSSLYETAFRVAKCQQVARLVAVSITDAPSVWAVSIVEDRTVLEGRNIGCLHESAARTTLRVNLELGDGIRRLNEVLHGSTPVLIVVSDLLEFLPDVRPFLRLIRSILRKNSKNRFLIGTPEASVSVGVLQDRGILRLWNLNEFEIMLEASGFVVNEVLLVGESRDLNGPKTILGEISCDEESYTSFLVRHSLPPSCDHLIVTTEHAKTSRTGGIGTYYQLAEECSGRGRLVLFCGGVGLPEDWSNYIARLGWMHSAILCGRLDANLSAVSILNNQEIIDATLLVTFIYDEICLIEYQDYQGIGAGIAQAKRADLLPASVYVCAYAHGNHLYLDNAAGQRQSERDETVDINERLSVEWADCVLFPSRFLYDFYTHALGYEIRHYVLQPYPVRLRESESREKKTAITKLVFVGKLNIQKGYWDFCEAVSELFQSKRYKQASAMIEKVVIIGASDCELLRSNLANVQIEAGMLHREEVVQKLRALADDSLVVLPYKGDNYPLSIFEVIDSGCQLIAYRAGGVPEQIPPSFHRQILCRPDPMALAASIYSCLRMPLQYREDLTERLRAAVALECDVHTIQYIRMIETLKKCEAPNVSESERKVLWRMLAATMRKWAARCC